MSAQASIVVGVDGSDCSRSVLNFAFDEIAADMEKSARAMVDAVVRERGGALADVPVDVRVVPGTAGRVLVDQARDADLLVVGHRGRGGLRSTMLGSVGLACLLHATVPVTVVPHDDAADH